MKRIWTREIKKLFSYPCAESNNAKLKSLPQRINGGLPWRKLVFRYYLFRHKSSTSNNNFFLVPKCSPMFHVQRNLKHWGNDTIQKWNITEMNHGEKHGGDMRWRIIITHRTKFSFDETVTLVVNDKCKWAVKETRHNIFKIIFWF